MSLSVVGGTGDAARGEPGVAEVAPALEGAAAVGLRAGLAAARVAAVGDAAAGVELDVLGARAPVEHEVARLGVLDRVPRPAALAAAGPALDPRAVAQPRLRRESRRDEARVAEAPAPRRRDDAACPLPLVDQRTAVGAGRVLHHVHVLARVGDGGRRPVALVA